MAKATISPILPKNAVNVLPQQALREGSHEWARKNLFGFLAHFGTGCRTAETRANITIDERCFMNPPQMTALLLLICLLQGCGPATTTNPPSPIANAEPVGDSPTFFEGLESNQAESIGGGVGMEENDVNLLDKNERYKALVNRVKPGMSKEQVEAILGMADESDEKDMGDLNPQKAGQILDISTWHEDTGSQSSIILSFINGRLQDGGTPGYDIRKGFLSQLPSNMTPEEKAKLKKAANGLGIRTDDE